LAQGHADHAQQGQDDDLEDGEVDGREEAPQCLAGAGERVAGRARGRDGLGDGGRRDRPDS
jgi:hypothetical protein